MDDDRLAIGEFHELVWFDLEFLRAVVAAGSPTMGSAPGTFRDGLLADEVGHFLGTGVPDRSGMAKR